MKNLGLVLAILAGITGKPFYIPQFLTSGLMTPQTIGKFPNNQWRESKHARSMRSRANRRKAKRKAKITG